MLSWFTYLFLSCGEPEQSPESPKKDSQEVKEETIETPESIGLFPFHIHQFIFSEEENIYSYEDKKVVPGLKKISLEDGFDFPTIFRVKESYFIYPDIEENDPGIFKSKVEGSTAKASKYFLPAFG